MRNQYEVTVFLLLAAVGCLANTDRDICKWRAGDYQFSAMIYNSLRDAELKEVDPSRKAILRNDADNMLQITIYEFHENEKCSNESNSQYILINKLN